MGIFTPLMSSTGLPTVGDNAGAGGQQLGEDVGVRGGMDG